jgi:hypothetical protein
MKLVTNLSRRIIPLTVTEIEAYLGFTLNHIGFNLIAKYRPISEQGLTSLESNYSVKSVFVLSQSYDCFGLFNNTI